MSCGLLHPKPSTVCVMEAQVAIRHRLRPAISCPALGRYEPRRDGTAHLPYAPVRIRIPRVIPTKTGWDIWGPRFDNKPRHPLGHHGSVGPSHSTIWSRLTTRGRFEYSRFGGSSLAGASDAIRVPYASIVDISPVGMDALIGVEAGKSHSTTACLWHKEVTARTMRSVSNWVRRF